MAEKTKWMEKNANNNWTLVIFGARVNYWNGVWPNFFSFNFLLLSLLFVEKKKKFLGLNLSIFLDNMTFRQN